MERTCIICYKNYDDTIFNYKNVCSSNCEKKRNKIENKFKDPKSFVGLMKRLNYIQDCNLIEFKKVTSIKEMRNFFKVTEFYSDLKNAEEPSPCRLKDANEFYKEMFLEYEFTF